MVDIPLSSLVDATGDYAAPIAVQIILGRSEEQRGNLLNLAERRAVFNHVVTDVWGITLTQPTLALALADETDAATIMASADLVTELALHDWTRAAVVSSGVALDALCASNTARDIAFASTDFRTELVAAQRFRNAVWKNDDAIADILANHAAVQTLFYDAATIDQQTLNGTTPVTLSDLDTEKDWLVIGVSWESTNNRTLTLTTLRPGSSRAASGPWLGAQAAGNSTQGDQLVYVPVVAPIQASIDTGGVVSAHFRVLDCSPA